MIPIITLLVIIQIFFAFACINLLKKKGRLNNWWVVTAATIPIIPYIIALKIPEK